MIGLRRTGLAEILTLGWQWTWSVTAVLSVEVLAAGAMIANAVAGEPAPANAGRRRFDRSGCWERLLDAATDRAVGRLTPDPQPVTAQVNGKANGQPGHSEAVGTVQTTTFDVKRDEVNGRRKLGKATAMDALLDFYAANPTASQACPEPVEGPRPARPLAGRSQPSAATWPNWRTPAWSNGDRTARV